jgi:chromosome partitioning protein
MRADKGYTARKHQNKGRVIPTGKQAKKPRIVAIINQKGGVGKSTTAVNLSAALGLAGKKILLVDFDPQGNATSGFGVEKIAGMKCVYDGLLKDEPAQELLVQTKEKNVAILPATINLAGAEVDLVPAISRETRLRDLLAPIKDDYDFILIDCPPSLGLLTINALTAADSLLIPIQCEFYALEGLSKLLDSMKLVKVRLNQELEVFGVLLTMYDGRTTLANQVVEEVEKYFGNKVFKTMIPRTVRLAEAPSYGESIFKYKAHGKGATAYSELAKEVIDRA